MLTYHSAAIKGTGDPLLEEFLVSSRLDPAACYSGCVVYLSLLLSDTARPHKLQNVFELLKYILNKQCSFEVVSLYAKQIRLGLFHYFLSLIYSLYLSRT